MHATRNQFTHGSLLTLVRDKFQQFAQGTTTTRHKISTTDCLMSALACFSLKYPSLLQFDKEASSCESTLRHNLKTLYGVDQAPCDTQMRERLDHMTLSPLRQAMKAVIARLQRGKFLDQWKFLDQYYVISLDGTGFFSSHDIHCKQCCEKHHRNGSITYHHQMVVGAMVNPSMKQVLPIGFEPIVKGDGDQKNDCERNASKRWLFQFRQDHPHLPTVMVADGLSSNDPFITMLEEHRCHYILVCKQDDHTYLWDWFNVAKAPDITVMEETVQGVHCTYRFMKDVPLNASSNKRVTVVHYKEVHPNGKTYRCGWVTDLEVTQQNIKNIVKGGRSRWKIESAPQAHRKEVYESELRICA
jgi:hypothetical protein